MKMEITVTEALEIINEIRKQPDSLFEMIRSEIKESVGQYLTELMETELTGFLGRGRYQRIEGDSNHRNGSYPRRFTLKGIGEVVARVPRDRQGEFATQVIPRSKQYEDALREDLSVMFLSGISTRTMALISEKLIGRRLSATEVSKASKQLVEAVSKTERSPTRQPLPADRPVESGKRFFIQKAQSLSRKQRKQMVDPNQKNLSIAKQCSLLNISRSSFYHRPKQISNEDLELMRLMDEQYMKTPYENPHLGISIHEKPSAETGLQNQPETGSTLNAADGSGSHLPPAQNQPAIS